MFYVESYPETDLENPVEWTINTNYTCVDELDYILDEYENIEVEEEY